MKTKHFSFKIADFKTSNDESVGIIEGCANVYGIVDSQHDRIKKGAFNQSVKNHIDSKKLIPMLVEHDYGRVIGGFDPTMIKDTDKGLYVVGKIDLNVQAGREMYSLIKNGIVDSFSVGGYAEMDDVKINNNGVVDIEKYTLREISITPRPSNVESKIESVKNDNSVVDIDKNMSDSDCENDFHLITAMLELNKINLNLNLN